MNKLYYLIATGLGTGFSPIAPGTVGSFLALIIVYLISPLSQVLLVIVLFIFFWIGVFTSEKVENEHGEDPSIVVIDEIVGMGISLLFLPKDLRLFFIAFVLFRFFDIWKPFPIHRSQNIHGGLGIMLDDVIAGIYALIVVHIVCWILF